MTEVNKPGNDHLATSPCPLFIRVFVSLYEDVEEQVNESKWKNHDGYHFVSRIIKPVKKNTSQSQFSKGKKNLKYALNIPIHIICNLDELTEFLGKAFGIDDNENYTIILGDDTLVSNLYAIKDNDKISIVKKDKLIKIAQLAEKVRKCQCLIANFSSDYLDFVKKHPFVLTLPNEWKSLETVDMSSRKCSEESKFDVIKKVGSGAIIPNLNQRVTVFDYNNELFYETPTFQDFLSAADKGVSREDLQARVKVLASMRGFIVVQPCGETLNQKNELKNVFQCIKYGKNRKGCPNKKTGGPFTLIYKKTHEAMSYQLAKFRSAHNHPLDEVLNSGSVIDYSNFKCDDAHKSILTEFLIPPIKKEETEDYSLDGLPSNESTNSKGRISSSDKELIDVKLINKSINEFEHKSKHADGIE